MEIKINKEIADYKESIYFGLSTRQFFFSVGACVVAVILYFLLKPYFNIGTLSWMCILGAAPFAVFGFVKYNGMYAEEFVKAWIKSEILMPKFLAFKGENEHYKIIEHFIEERKKERKREDEIFRKTIKKKQNRYEDT